MFNFLRSWMSRKPACRTMRTPALNLNVQSLEDRSVPAGVSTANLMNPLFPSGVPTNFVAMFSPQPSADMNSSLIKGYYNTILGRAPSPTELLTWYNSLNNGLTPSQLATGLLNSTEARTKEVVRFYQDILGRTPAAAEVTGWVADLQNGASETSVFEAFLDSAEFSGIRDNSDFVTALYQVVLNRQPDPASAANWIAALNAGTLSRAQLVVGIVNSNEAVLDTINLDYSAILERAPAAADTISLLPQLQSGSLTYSGLMASLLASQEYSQDALANR